MPRHRQILTLSRPTLARRVNQSVAAGEHRTVGRRMRGKLCIPLQRWCVDERALAVVRGKQAIGEFARRALDQGLRLRGSRDGECRNRGDDSEPGHRS
jgi:hypothetical protein